MTVVDWIIVVFVVLLAVVGRRQGFVAGALALIGFGAGAFLGSRVGPLLLEGGSSSPYAPLFALGGAALAGTLLAGILEGFGSLVRGTFVLPGLKLLDGMLGAALSALIGLGLAWMFGVVALQVPQARDLRADIQRSVILQALNDVLPPSTALNALAVFDPYPHVDGPEADVAPPRAAVARDPEVAAAGRSVVKIRGTACGLGVEGSGWVAGDGLVVTNAHVVAGQDDTTVQLRGEGPALPAVAVAFVPRDDIAVLRVGGLDAPALSFAADASTGTSAAVLGFPLDGPYDVRAARLGRTRDVLTRDAYGAGPLRRSITSFRGYVRPGNSGGPLVDTAGQVVGTVFAAATNSPTRGGYAVPNAVVGQVLETASAPVDTGPCTG